MVCFRFDRQVSNEVKLNLSLEVSLIFKALWACALAGILFTHGLFAQTTKIRKKSNLGGSQICSAEDIESDSESIRKGPVSKEGKDIRKKAFYLSVKILKYNSSGTVVSSCSGVRAKDSKTIISAGHCFFPRELTKKQNEEQFTYKAVVIDAHGKPKEVNLESPKGEWNGSNDIAVARMAEFVDLPPGVRLPTMSKTSCGAPKEPAAPESRIRGLINETARAFQRRNLAPAFLVGHGVINETGPPGAAKAETADCAKVVPLNNLKQHGTEPALWVDFHKTKEVNGIKSGKGCFGDSGGAIFCEENGELALGGIVGQLNPNRDPKFQSVLKERSEGTKSSLEACKDKGNTGLWVQNISVIQDQIENFERSSIEESYLRKKGSRNTLPAPATK